MFDMCGLQLFLLPLHAVSGLSLRHDDTHQLVQVGGGCIRGWWVCQGWGWGREGSVDVFDVCGLQLFLLPLHAVSDLPLCHDDPHQLVQVGGGCIRGWKGGSVDVVDVCDLQLFLLPLHAVSGLSLCHDDPDQLVQVGLHVCMCV